MSYLVLLVILFLYLGLTTGAELLFGIILMFSNSLSHFPMFGVTGPGLNQSEDIRGRGLSAVRELSFCLKVPLRK